MRIESSQHAATGAAPAQAAPEQRRPSPLRGMSFADQQAALAPQGAKGSGHAAAPPAALGAPGGGGSVGAGCVVDPAIAKFHARQLVATGLREETELTDQTFFRLFPWLADTKLKAGSPEASAWAMTTGNPSCLLGSAKTCAAA